MWGSKELMEIKDTHYFIIEHWMISKLGLKGVERDVYAVIYGFTKGLENQCYSSSLENLAELIGSTKRSVITAINSLKEKNLITIENQVKKGYKTFTNYSANISSIPNLSEEISNSSEKISSKSSNLSEKISSKYENLSEKISLQEDSIIIEDNNLIEENIKDATVRKILAHLNDLLGTNYSIHLKENTKLIKALLNKGYTEEEILKVIDKKFIEWKGTDFEKYIRPSTLFGSKFEQYLNQPITKDMETKLWLMTPEGDNNGIQ